MQPLLQAEGADEETHDNHQNGVGHHGGGVGADLPEGLSHLLRVQAAELAGGGGDKILDHPAGNGGVKHHEQVVARHGGVAVEVPLAPPRLQLLVQPHRTFLAGPAQGKLNGHNRNAHDDQEKQVKQHKSAAAILPGHIGEFPHIPDSNGAAGAEQNETQPAA